MTDISKEAVEWIAQRAGEQELDYDTPVAATLRAQAARIEQLEAEKRNIVSHATGGGSKGEGMSLNDICVRITAFRNRLWSDAQSTARADALREAADAGTEWASRQYSIEDVDADFFVRNPILALIDKEPTHSGKPDYPAELRRHAKSLIAAATFFDEFQGSNCGDHGGNLHDAARAFMEDADEYEDFNKEPTT